MVFRLDICVNTYRYYFFPSRVLTVSISEDAKLISQDVVWCRASNICMHMHIGPMTKVISLSQKAYEALKRQKRQNESFSDVVLRMTRGAEPSSIIGFAGRWSGDDADDVLQFVMREREAASVREHVV